MMRWVAMAVACGVGIGNAALAKGNFESDFTELTGPGCVVAAGAETSAECPGLMGYRVNVDREDGKTFLRLEKGGYTAVVPEEGVLRFTSKLEWRRKGEMPLAVIVHAVVSGKNGADREVVLVQGLDGNVRMKGTHTTDAKARAQADKGRATPR